MEALEIHAVVDDVELPLGNAEARLNLPLHHARIADHGSQPRTPEQPASRAENVAVVGIERKTEPAEGPERRATVVQPLGMHAVPGAIDVATGDAFVRLNQIEGPARELTAHRAGETPVSPQASHMKRIAANDSLPVTHPFARQQRHGHALRPECIDRSLDETLGTPVGVVALPHQREMHAFSIPCQLEPLAQSANALEHVEALRVERFRVDCVDSKVSNRWNQFKTLPRLRRLAPEAAGDDRFGPRVQDLFSGNERRDGLCTGKNIAPAAKGERIADEVGAAHREHGPVPDLEKDGQATLARVALAQSVDFPFEVPCAGLGGPHAAGQRADRANDAGNIRERAYLGDEYPDAGTLQTIDLQRRIAALPGEYEIRPQRNQALDVHPAVGRHHGQPLRLGRVPAEA